MLMAVVQCMEIALKGQFGPRHGIRVKLNKCFSHRTWCWNKNAMVIRLSGLLTDTNQKCQGILWPED